MKEYMFGRRKYLMWHQSNKTITYWDSECETYLVESYSTGVKTEILATMLSIDHNYICIAPFGAIWHTVEGLFDDQL